MIIRKKHLVFIVSVLGILAIALIAGIMYISHKGHKTVNDVKPIRDTAVDKDDKICIKLDEYQRLMQSQATTSPQQTVMEQPTVAQRDYRVLQDPLYPPLNRTDNNTFQTLQRQQSERQETSVRAINDTYHLVGYLVNQEQTEDSGGNKWKLIARMKDRNTADFYMIPANKNYDIKIHVTNDMVVGERLRDIYTIPNNVTFNSPLLNKGPYEYVEIDKSDLSFTNGGMFM